MISFIREGDVIGFVADRWNLGHALIRLGQLHNGGDNNGFHNIVHVGVVVEVNGVLSLVEFTVTKLFPIPIGGMRTTPLAERIESYKHGVVWFALRKTARAKMHIGSLRQWVYDHCNDKYNLSGLIFAIMRWFVGWQFAGRMFCSEAVRAALSESGAWNGHRYALAMNGKPRKVTARIEPQRWSPRDVAEANIFEHWEVLDE